MQSELNKSKQYFRSIGTVNELALKLEDCDCKYKDKDGNQVTKKGERIMGNVSVRTGRGIHVFSVYFQSVGYDGEENKRWKMANDMLSWNPEINGNKDEPVTMVNIEGTVDINDYPKDGKVYSNLRWRVGKASTKVAPDETTGTSLVATCYLHSIKPEIVNEDETGRLLVTFMCGNGKGACFPVDAILDEKALVDILGEDAFEADDFTDAVETGNTYPITFERVCRHVGDKKKAKKMLGGKGSVDVNNGFDIEELLIVGVDEKVEEPEETEDEDGNPIKDTTGYIDPAVMKKAMKIRANMLDELKNNPPEKKGGKAESFKDKKAKASGKSMGKNKNVDVEDEGEDSDDPFNEPDIF